MNKYLMILGLIVASGPLSAQETNAPQDLAPFAFMTGAWASANEQGTTEEFWTGPAGEVMLGLNRSVKAGAGAWFEYLRIEARPDGVFYVAAPKGSSPTDFKFVGADGDGVHFENPEHDFPQRISYRLDGQQLVARIEGTSGDRKRSAEWRLERVP